MRLSTLSSAKFARHVLAASALLIVGVSGVAAASPTKHQTQLAASKKAPKAKHIKKGEEGSYDITETATGKKYIKQAVDDFKDQFGHNFDPSSLRAYNFESDDSPDVLVMTKSADFAYASTTVYPDGSVETRTGIAPRDPLVVAQDEQAKLGKSQIQPMQGTSWTRIDEPCFKRSNNTGENFYCAHTYKSMNDYSNTKDYYQLNLFGSAKASGSWGMTRAHVESWRNSSTSGPLTWVDWNPKNPIDAGSSGSLPVPIGIDGLSLELVAQEKFVPTFWSSEPGHYKVEWRHTYAVFNSQIRSPEFNFEVSVPQGQRVAWIVDGGFYCTLA